MTRATTTDRAAPPVETDRIPPHDLDAEMAALGSMMLDRQAVEAVLPVINRHEAEWFYRPDHRLIFELLIDVYDRGDPLDLVVVRDELQRRGQLDEVGGVDRLVVLAESVPTWTNAEYYARIVRDKGLLRDLIRCAGQISETAYAQAEPAANIMDVAEEQLFAVTERRASQQAVSLAEIAGTVYAQIESHKEGHLSGLPTGYYELDELTSGLQRGDLIIIAARPSMGKTALGLNIAEHLAVDARDENGRRFAVAFFSMEMGKEQIALRILCSRGKVSSHSLRKGALAEADIASLGYACAELEAAPLYIDDTPGMTALELRSKCRRLKRQYDIQCVFVDYLQLMHAPSVRESRQVEMATISRSLKGLARELHVPVVAMAQLNRATESREGNRPRMADLRESGAIEQDADVIMLLHREDYYRPKDESVRNQAEVIVDKQRNGPTGAVHLQFNKRLSRFNNLDVTHVPPPEPGGGFDEEPAPF